MFIFSGTQSIKKEGAVYIKEKPLIDICEENFDSDTLRRHNLKLTSQPMVYTTRLDQMNAFNHITRHTSAETTEMILVASKPQYKQILNKIKTDPSSDACNISSYITLCSQVQHLNSIVKIEANLRSKKLMNIKIKPLVVVVEDNGPVLRSKKDHCEFVDYSSDEYVSPSYSSDECEPLKKFRSRVTKTTKVLPTIITVAIKDKRSQEADIYIIDENTSVKSFYRTSIDKCDKLKKLHRSIKKMIIEYCCWVDREKKLIKFAVALAGTVQFLRKPHNCLPRPCSCCCVVKLDKQPEPEPEDEFVKKLHKEEDTIPSIPVSNLNIIEKANNYIPRVHNIIPTTCDESTDFLKCAVIIFKYQRIILTQAKLLGENYEIGNKGEIIDYVRPTVNRSITEEKQLYHNNASNINRIIYLSYLVCCWHHREGVMTQLRDSRNLSSSALRFMRTPHLCSSDKCECCCKLVPLINFTLENIAVHNPSVYRKKPSQVKVLKDDKKKQIIDLNTYKTPDIMAENIEIQNAKTKKNTENRTTNNCRAPRKFNKSSSKPKTSKKKSTVLEHIDLTIDSCRDQIQTPTNPKTTTQIHPNVSNMMKSSSKHFADPTQSQTTLITGFLEKFKNLKLSVDDNGKLTALINTLPGKLTTIEIKVLSDILKLASTQIEQLGITAQEFCNRVNAPKTEKSSICPLLPRFVPIHPNIGNKKRINKSQMAKNSVSKTTLQCVKPSMPILAGCCKTHQLKTSVPITHNKTPVSTIYQMMSNIGSRKNQELVQAYRLHFKDDENEKRPLPKIKNPAMLSKTDEVFSLRDNEPRARASATKRKTLLTAKGAPKKVRKTHLENLPKHPPAQKTRNLSKVIVNTIDKSISDKVVVQKSVEKSKHNPIPRLLSSSCVKQVPSTSGTIVTNRNVAPIESTSGTDVLKSIIGADCNQIPIFVQNNNCIPMQNTSVANPLEIITENGNQTPHFDANSNFMPFQDIMDTHGSESIIKAEHNQIPFDIPDNNVILKQSAGVADVPLFKTGAGQKQMPIYFDDINIPTAIPVQNPISTDSHQPIMLTDENEIPVFTDNYDSKLQITKNTNFPQPETKAENQTRTYSNVTSIQKSIDAVAGGRVGARNPFGPSDNPILHRMLATASASPSPLSSGPRLSHRPQIQPLILAHCKDQLTTGKVSKSSRKNKAPVPVPKKLVHVKQINPKANNEMDIEGSLTANVIVASKSEFSQEEILDAVNNKQLIEDEEEDGIFGV